MGINHSKVDALSERKGRFGTVEGRSLPSRFGHVYQIIGRCR
jgi:hypothetical protein